jgi:hypothetical protein
MTRSFVGGKEGEAQDAADVRPADPFGFCQLSERGKAPLLEHSLPAVRTRQRLEERAVDLRQWRPVVTARRCHCSSARSAGATPLRSDPAAPQ